MKKIINLQSILSVTLCALVLVLNACTSGNGVKNPVALHLSPAQQQITVKCNDFSFNLMREVYEVHSGAGNVIVSPLSASMLLGMIMNGAAGTTLEEMQTVLDFSDESMADINAYYQTLMEALPALDESNIVKLANGIWIDENYPVKSTFKELNKEYFFATVENVNFQSSSTADRINKWASDNTNKLIKQIVSPYDIVDARLLLANALYFKGQWQEKFKSKDTKTADFTTFDGRRVDVDRMNLVKEFQYADLEYGKALQMYYKDKKYCMDLILPNSGVSVKDVLAKLDSEEFQNILQRMKIYEVTVGLPKFKTSFNADLTNILKAMGMPTVFDPSYSDLSPISEQSHLFLSQVKQFCYMNVDEEGTEAAAVTWGKMTDCVEPLVESRSFIADRPFILLIREVQYGTVLFVGVVGNPSND